ncbi:MAG: alpha/beta fold hydrolase [Gaiellaceae bacterium]
MTTGTRPSRASNSGVEIAYEVVGSGPPLVLVQGLGYGGGRGWGPALDLLAEDFLIVSYDNRGFGASDAPAGPYTVAQLAGDAAAVLDAAGLERASVLGVSLGGMAAQELALTRPDRVDRLVLVSTTPGFRGHPMPARTVSLMLEAAQLDPAVALRRFVENALGSGDGEELTEQIVAYRTAHPPDPDGWKAQAAAGATHDAIERLAAIAAPTLVLHGAEDAVVDPRNGELLAESIPGARLELFRGAGHLLSWEEPERFAELVRRFLL